MTLVVVVHLMIVVAMIGVVLLQKSEGGGLGIGSTGGFLTSRGTANVLTRATAILAALFFLTSLGLSIMAGMGRKPHSTSLRPRPRHSSSRVRRRRRSEKAAVYSTRCANRVSNRHLPRRPRRPRQPEAPAPTGPQVPQSR